MHGADHVLGCVLGVYRNSTQEASRDKYWLVGTPIVVGLMPYCAGKNPLVVLHNR